jgi:hypothetical protein
VKNRRFFPQPPWTASRRSGKALHDPAFVHGIYVCSWITADLIALVWDLDAARKTALEPWNAAARLVGHYSKPTPEDPPRTRVDAFPTTEELSEIQKCAI